MSLNSIFFIEKEKNLEKAFLNDFYRQFFFLFDMVVTPKMEESGGLVILVFSPLFPELSSLLKGNMPNFRKKACCSQISKL